MVGALLTAPLRAAPAAPSAAVVTVPRFTHPGAGQTFYFLLTDRFANGSTSNDTGGLTGGPGAHGFDPTRLTHYHGGDFAGLTAHLDYLKRLGVTALWVTPPFRNQPVRHKPGLGFVAGYHGYWILDFLHIDPHLGTEAEFQAFVRAAHDRGLRVYLDIVVNHTADVIRPAGDATYRDSRAAPYRDAAGRPFDVRAVAFNGVNDPAAFPALTVERSFPLLPVVPAGAEHAKSPAWLNDVTLYHNRGDRGAAAGESAVFGDFRGLDGVFTEHPRVVQGFIEVFGHWLETAGVDGFRIDTAKHVNAEFWQAFIPALRARARALGRPDFLQFGEVHDAAGDPAYLSEFSTGIPLDATLDFGFFVAARRFVAQGRPAAELAEFFAGDDAYTDHDSNVHATTTFLGNHDAGRFAHFLERDNPGATPEQLADLVKLGHGLLLLARGQPVIYYGDEQGMIGRGGDHDHAREDMFASRTPEFAGAARLGTTRAGAEDKFDERHPFYRLIARLAALRAEHRALRTGAMIVRPTAGAHGFAFSRIDRGERVEYLVGLNNSRTQTIDLEVPTSQPAGAGLAVLFDSRAAEGVASGPDLVADAAGRVRVTLAPLQFAVWRAVAPLRPVAGPRVAWTTPAPGATLAFTSREVEGLVFPSRQELRAEVAGGDGVAEVTFVLERGSRPGQWEWLGTDDAAPYRVFWRPPPDLAPGERLTFFATVNDLRGHRVAAPGRAITVAPSERAFGIRGARVPVITAAPPGERRVKVGETVVLTVGVEGTAPFEYQWLRDGEEVTGATAATVEFTASAATAGAYQLLVRNRAGTTLSGATTIGLVPAGD